MGRCVITRTKLRGQTENVICIVEPAQTMRISGFGDHKRFLIDIAQGLKIVKHDGIVATMPIPIIGESPEVELHVFRKISPGFQHPAIVQIGNEISPGMLWPLGNYSGTESQAQNTAALFNAGAKGCKEASPNTQIMLHIIPDGGGCVLGAKFGNGRISIQLNGIA